VIFFQSPDSYEKLNRVQSSAERRSSAGGILRNQFGATPCSVIEREPEQRLSTHLSGRSTLDGGATPSLVPVNP